MVKEKQNQTFSKNAEQMVLGCMLASEESFHTAFERDVVFPTDFYYREHQTIFLSLKALFDLNKPADVHLLSEELKKNSQLPKVGGISYLTDLANLAGTSAYFESYVKDLKELSARREFILRCEELAGLASSGKEEITTLSSIASQAFEEITKKTQSTQSLSLRQLAEGDGISFLNQLRNQRKKRLQEGANLIPGLPTGFSFLDSHLGGLREENLILIAARPSVGKTAFALNLARYLGLDKKIPVGFFSLEMTPSQIFLRLVSAQSGIPANKIETGHISDSEMEQIETAVQQISESKIFINDSYAISKILPQMRKLCNEHGVRAFFIDYIGLVEPLRQREIKAYEIGDITRALKNFANEYCLPIVCLAQLNRQADQNIRPQLSMLKDSGNLEQDADSVIFLHRKDLYDPQDKSGQIEVIIAKNRHGPTDSKSHFFKKETGIISEFSDQPLVSWS